MSSGLLSLMIAVFALSWLAAVLRFAQVLRRAALGEQIRWRMWGVVLCMLLAATAYFADFGGVDMAMWPSIFGALAYLIGAHISYRQLFPPFRRPAWNHPLWGLLVLAALGAITGLLYATRLPAPVLHATGDLVFDAYILLTTLRVILPALSWTRRLERNRLARTRLVIWLGLYATVVVWMACDIVGIAARAAGLSYQLHDRLRPYLVSLIGLLFVLAFFAPAGVCRWLAKGAAYLSNVLSVACLGLLASQAGRWVGVEPDPGPLGLWEVLRAPEFAVYCLTIALLDARKLLKAHPDRAARALGDRLDLAAGPALEYTEVVERLRGVSYTFLPRLILQKAG